MILNLLSAQTNIWKYIFVDSILSILEGLGNTLLIVLCSFPIGIVIGGIIGMVHFIPNNNIFVKIWKWVNKAYVSIFRGTPIVVQLLFLYFGVLSQIGIPGLVVAILVFGLNSGAYVSEMVRAGIASVDKGQLEAGRSLGLSYSKTMIKIIIPQAIKNIIPTLGNELISLTKETSIAGYVSITDVTFAMRMIMSSRLDYFIPYFVLGVIYFILVYLITLGLKAVERRLAKSDKR